MLVLIIRLKLSQSNSFDIYFNEVGSSESLLATVPRGTDDLTGGLVAFGGGDDLLSIDNVKIDAMTTGYKEEQDVLPSKYLLAQNYPNPFNPSTIIKFGITELSNVKLTLYNLLGQKITELVNGEKSPGYYEVQFDASKLSSGIYIYRLEASSKEKSFVQVKKMILMK